MEQPSTQAQRKVIIDALALARERVTGDDPGAKEEARDRFQRLRRRVILAGEGEGELPSAQEVLAVLGDDDPAVRRAVREWNGEAADEAAQPPHTGE